MNDEEATTVTSTDAQTELLTIPARWDFEYRYFAGAAASRFFQELREHLRIMGTRCDGCGRTLVPARAYCDVCFRRTSEWVEIGSRGQLDAFTILATQFPGLPKPPKVLGYVTLEGADTAILNYVEGIALNDLDEAAALLMRKPQVTVEFGSVPEGRITDFHFRIGDTS